MNGGDFGYNCHNIYVLNAERVVTTARRLIA